MYILAILAILAQMQVTQQPSKKKFCKYCWDRGLSTAVCFSHFVKDRKGPGGVIICPTLLSDDCMRCGLRGHTPQYCTSTTPLLTVDYPDPSDINLGQFDFIRLIRYETWIEPIPPHLRAAHTKWKISAALQRRRREMAESRYGLCEDYDPDIQEGMLGLVSSRCVEDVGGVVRTRNFNEPYSDYEHEVLTKFEVNNKLFGEHFPNGCINPTKPERETLRDIVSASVTVFYSLTADETTTTKTFHIHHSIDDGGLDLNLDLDSRPTLSKFSESDYQTRVLAILNDPQHRRRQCK